MHVADILALAGSAPPTSGSGDRPAAPGFEGLLETQAGSRQRGLLGVGRRLAEQTQAEVARLDDGSALTGGEALVLPGLLSGLIAKPPETPADPGAGGAKTGAPLINPGQPVDQSDTALVNPGVPTDVTGQPLVNPGAGQAKAEQPLINPGAPAKDAAQTLPGETPDPTLAAEALGDLAEAGQTVRADAAVAAVRQAVGQAPEVATTPVPPPAPVTEPAEAPAPDLSLDVPAPEPLDAAGPTPTAAASSGANASSSAAAEPTAPRAEADRVEAPSVAEVEPMAAEAEAPAAPAATETVNGVPGRVEGQPVHRLAADAIAQVSAQIIRRLEGRSTRFDMELNPVELGRVDVRLDIDAEGRLAARLAFDNPAAAAELRGRVDDLRRELEQAGFQLSEDALSFADRQGGRDPREGMADGSLRAFARSAEASDQADLAAQPALRVMTRLGLDVRV